MTHPRRLLLAAAACAFLACTPARAADYKNLELRLVSESAGQPFPLWKDPGTLSLDPQIQFSGKDFSLIAPAHGGDDLKTPSLNLNFTKEAAERFTALTTRSAGRRLAVLVDGKVVTAPKILHPISTGLFEITGASEQDIQDMYRLIAGPPAAPKISFGAPCAHDRSAELKSLADLDQADRAHFFTMSPKAMLKMTARDDKRRRRVAEIFAEGCVQTAADYADAALVFQHGNSPDHFLLTSIWAARAVALGDPDAQWLVSRGIDRYLESSGSKQLYATQFFGDERGCYCLWPVEETATDADRAKLGAKPLAEQLKSIETMGAGKSCGAPKMCDIDAKPVPKGSIPGVAW